MIKKAVVFLIIILVLSSVGVVKCSPEAPLEGAKIVSEDAYFWLQIINNWTAHFGRVGGSDVFVRIPDDFSVHMILVNNEVVNNLTWTFGNSTMETVISMNPGDVADVLLSAPFLLPNETVRHVLISVGLIPFSGGTSMLIDFPISVLSLGFVTAYEALKGEYEQSLNQTSSMNATLVALQTRANDLSNENVNLTANLGILKQEASDANAQVSRLDSQLTLETSLTIFAFAVAAFAIASAVYFARRKRVRS